MVNETRTAGNTSTGAQAGGDNNTVKSPPKPPEDAVVNVLLRERNMSAAVNVTSPKNGGADVTYEMLSNALEEAGVVFGLTEATVKKVADEKIYGRDVTVAVYKPPTAGVNGTINYKFDKYVAAVPAESEDGSVDFRELGQIRTIFTGTVIAEITDPVEGTAGTDVLGREITPTPPKKAAFSLGVGTVLSPDGKTIKAEIDGLLVFEKVAFCVRRVLNIKEDIDFNTGNIEFLGDINVNGNVGEGFKVVSTGGSVTIQGGVFSGALIKARRDIDLKQVANHATIDAGGSLTAAFCEYCEIRANRHITAQTLLVSNVFCGGTLTTKGKTGGLIGGKYTILDGAFISNNVGSPHYPTTEIFLGNNTVLADERERLLRTIDNRENEITDLGMIIDYLNEKKKEGRLEFEKEELLGESVRKRIMRRGDIAAAKKRILEIEKHLEKRQSLRIEISGTIYSKTRININTEKFDLKDDWTRVAISLTEDSEINISPL
jgi:uncharacterized protein (DUF342 family)